MNTAASGTLDLDPAGDSDYDRFLGRVRARFEANLAEGSALFATDASGLFDAYLESIEDPATRQLDTCSACRRFVERYGGLVTLDAKGMATPVFWNPDDAPESHQAGVAAMAKRVSRAEVTGVFYSSDSVWGRPETGSWRHFAVIPPATRVFSRPTQTARQAMAEKREDLRSVMRTLSELTESRVAQAVTLLRTDALYRSEKVLGQAEWLHAVLIARQKAKGRAKVHVVWRAVADAPAGFCHPRSSMIGTLLEDIAAGMSFPEVSRRFAAKMHPLRYQRPQALPSAGAIAKAEKLAEQLGLASALPRRFARLDELPALWKPTPPTREAKPTGVFGHLKAKRKTVEAIEGAVPPQVLTWEKFQRTVLPTAETLELLAPARGSYSSLVTALNADAPPILQWDHEDRRNPFSWYFWHGGATAEQFGLKARTFHAVSAIVLQPSMWNGGSAHHGKGVFFVIEGARDLHTTSGCLFPEFLKSELHAVRSVIEAYSKDATVEGADEASAAGVMLQGGEAWRTDLRVVSGGIAVRYTLDRWD